ncbi:unnamed protein product [Miscanthus lutarioriparius]|uniref:Late embryogenesis abundant protein LEA-2 subgroup domain-containing protein n=1 Tax=Miscanthus lutarioriparius TaxID=422564 RepID=A0A811P1X2_9POAL|nr:unnamed protein product [Miscanthus lutarioriparius]
MAAYEKHQPEAPLNAAYYGQPIPPPQPAYYPPPPPPPPRPAPRRGGCARCLLGSLVALVVALGVAVLVLWLIFRPDNLKAYADSATLSRFDLGNGNGNGGGDLLQYNLTVVIRVRNPNRFGIRYDYAEAQAFYDGDRFGFDPLQPFYLDSKSDARITATFGGSTVVDDDDARRTYRRENGEGFYYVKVKVYSDLSFRVRVIRRHDFKSKITCVLRLPVPAAGGNVNTTALTTLGTRCDVDF